MPSVKFKDTQTIGNSSSSVEYEFAEYSDFKDWQKCQREIMQESVKSMVDSIMASEEDFIHPTGYETEDFAKDKVSVVDISVGKKPNKPTKH